METENRIGSSKHPGIAEEENVVHSDESLQSKSEKSKNCDVTKDDLENATSEVKHSHAKTSSADYFQIDASRILTSDDFQIDPSRDTTSESVHKIAPPKEESTSSQVEEKIDDVEDGTLHELEETFGSSRSFSQFSAVTHESFALTLSPTKSPPIQVMERPKEYDPNRISASIFSKPPEPLDWSAASNDSLFSIQIGNMSFARDRKLGGDTSTHTGRSADFNYSSEWYRSGELKSPGEVVRLRQHSPAKIGGDHRLQCIDSGKSQVFGKPEENGHNEAISNQGRSDSDEAYSLTDDSNSNGHSCVSPIKNSSSSCLCSWCSCTFCSYKQLYCGTCLPKRPCCSSCSCKGLNWSSCCSCKYLNWPNCSYKSLCMPSNYCKWPGCSCSYCSCLGCHQCLGGSRCSCRGLNWLSCCSCKSSCGPSNFCCKRPSCSSCSQICSGCSSCNCKGLIWSSCCSKPH